MIREKIDASREKEIILYSIVNTEYLKEIYPIAKADLFKSPYAKTVWSWCAQYYSEFNKAPSKDIQDIYIAHKMEVQDDDEEEAIAVFLQSLSNMDESPHNLEYLIKKAVEWLNLRSLEILREALDDAILRKDIISGQEAVAEYSSIKRNEVNGVNVLKNVDAAVAAFNTESEFLFSFPGAMGAVIGNIKRTDFVSFLAFAKRGKSAYLWEAAKQAMFNYKKVLFVSLEMSQNEVMRRIWTSLAKKPEETSTVTIPFFVEDDASSDDGPKYIVDYEERQIEALDASEEFFTTWISQYRKYFQGGDVKVVAMPARSVTVKDIISYIDNLEYYEQWLPDVVVIDYADLIASKVKGDVRHQLDDIWANLRRLALERNIAVFTASQSGRSSANSDATEETIAEDIRKIAHVTKMISINATKEEKANGIHRLAQLAVRDGAPCFEQAVVLSCLDIGQMCLDSKFRSEVNMGGRDE